MTRFSAWCVFRNGLSGGKSWGHQWHDPDLKIDKFSFTRFERGYAIDERGAGPDCKLHG